MFAVAAPSRTRSRRILIPSAGLTRQPQRQPEVAQEREIRRIAFQPLAIGRLRLGVTAHPVEGDPLRRQQRHVVRPPRQRHVQVGQRRVGLPRPELGAREFQQHRRILGPPAVRLVQRLPQRGCTAPFRHSSGPARPGHRPNSGPPRMPAGRAPPRSGNPRPRRNAPRAAPAPLPPPPARRPSSRQGSSHGDACRKPAI